MARETYLYDNSNFDKDENYEAVISLNQEERAEILSLVDNHNNVSVIKERFPQIPKGRFDQFIPLVLSDEKCEKCDGAIYNRYERDINRKTLRQIGKECIDCGHNFESDCTCNSCNTKAENLWKLYLVKNFPKPLEVDSLSADEKVKLSIILNTYQDPDSPYIRFFPKEKNRYRYGSYISYETLANGLDSVVYDLKKQGIIKPAPSFNRNLIKLKDNGTAEIHIYEVTDVLWDINLALNGEKLVVADYLNLVEHKDFTIEEKSILWRSIYRNEIQQYLDHQALEIFHFDFNEIMVDFITDLFIEKYSLSQAFSQIYYAMSMSLRYLAKYNTNKQKVTANFRNNIIRNMERFGRNKATRFNRPSYVEGSYINNYILDNILRIKGDYFSAYTEDIIPEFVPFMVEAD
ncbi:MAG TPA: hypothetical protein VK050_06610 [Flavobacteriaceae bacterium]|nr:hypothetical protein [Flavobacteriaceae bacterium]